MLEALYASFVLDGLSRRLRGRWPSVPADEIDYLIAEATDVLYQAISRGEKVLNLVAYLWKVADRKVFDYHEMRQRERLLTDAELETVSAGSPQVAPDPTTGTDEQVAEEDDLDRRRQYAIATARRLLPRLGQQNIQAVMAYVIDAVEAGRQDVPNSEISEALGLSPDTVRTSLSRGLRRLARISRDEGLSERGLDLVGVDTDDPAPPSDDGA